MRQLVLTQEVVTQMRAPAFVERALWGTEMQACSHGLPLPTFPFPSPGKPELSHIKYHGTPKFQTQKCTFLNPQAIKASDVQ